MEIFSIIAFVCYGVATAAVLTRLFHQSGPNLVLVLALGSVAMVCHAISATNLLYSGQAVNFSLPNAIQVVSLLIVLTVSLIALRFKINLILPVVYGFASIWQLVIIFLPSTDKIPLTAEKLVLVSHITLALIAYCILVIATLYSIQVAYINLKLKSKNIAAVSHLPPLMQVEQQLFTILGIGTLCLAISELTGLLFLDSLFAKDTIHKTVLSLIAFVMYLGILWGHHQKGWRGNKIMTLTISATLILTLSYFGSRFVKEFLI